MKKRKIISFLVLAASLLFIFENSKKKKVYSSVDKTNLSKDPLVFIHGIKGSKIINTENGNIHWLTRNQALGIDNPNLQLPLIWDEKTKTQKRDLLIASEILDKITIIPSIFEEPIYSGVLEKAKTKYENFYPFAYDWRHSNLDNLSSYLKFIRRIVKRHNKPVKVIAHSMGGLITMAALQEEPELFETVFFAGVPFDGGVGFLEDMHAGTSTGLNNKSLNQETLASMPSSYSLFSLDCEGCLSDGQKQIDIDFFNPNDWQKLKIGPFAYEFSNNETFKNHFKLSLEAGKKFRKKLINGNLISNGELKTKQPKIYVILGNSLETKDNFIKNGPDSVLGWDFKNGRKEVGDGRVTVKKGYPPKELDYEDLLVPVEHSVILNDKKVLDWIFSKI